MSKDKNNLHLNFENLITNVASSQSNLVPNQPSEAATSIPDAAEVKTSSKQKISASEDTSPLSENTNSKPMEAAEDVDTRDVIIQNESTDNNHATKEEIVLTTPVIPKRKKYKRKKSNAALSIYTLLSDYEQPPSKEIDFTSIRVIGKKSEALKLLYPKLTKVAIYDKIITEHLRDKKAALKNAALDIYDGDW